MPNPDPSPMTIPLFTGPAPTHYATLGVWWQSRAANLRETARLCGNVGYEHLRGDYARMANDSEKHARTNFRRAKRMAQRAKNEAMR